MRDDVSLAIDYAALSLRTHDLEIALRRLVEAMGETHMRTFAYRMNRYPNDSVESNMTVEMLIALDWAKVALGEEGAES